MYGLGINVTDEATPILNRIPRALREEVLPIIGRAASGEVRSHLFELDRERPNAMGARRTHFYARAARATNYRLQAGGVVVSINHLGLALRFFGGTVKPVNAKALTIPAAPEAYGRRAREFGDLKPFLFTPRPGRKAFGGLKRGKGRDAKVLYWFVREMEYSGDETVLPTAAQIADAIETPVLSYVNRKVFAGK